ncbi:hypothetical protein FACS1894162_6180 [Bacteroidia bacterium]|nr:hypothetical protein FACS1894162_6180 [Bacteroidia bacterium]
MLLTCVATLAFVSCTKDNDFFDENGVYETYTGTDGEDAVTLVFTSTTYSLIYNELGGFSEGTWTKNASNVLTLTGKDSQNPNLTGTFVKGDAKELTLTSGALTFNLKKK